MPEPGGIQRVEQVQDFQSQEIGDRGNQRFVLPPFEDGASINHYEFVTEVFDIAQNRRIEQIPKCLG